MSSSSSFHFSFDMKDALDETPVSICSNFATPVPKVGIFGTPIGDSPNWGKTPVQDSNGLERSEGIVLNLDPERAEDMKDVLDETPVPISSNFATPEPKVGIFGTPIGDSPYWGKTLVRDSNGLERSEGNVLNLDMMGKKFSEVSFLRRVLREEMGDDCNVHKLVVIAVHTVLLETGFVGFDRFHLPDEWSSKALAMSIRYTLPELLVNASNSCETVVLKFQCLGQFVNVYGSLANEGSGLHWVRLNEYRFAPTIDLVWARNDSSSESCSSSYPENEVVEFWKIVKDDLALPLLIDLCERSCLLPPPCFTGLPSEIKLKILESLAGVDVAKACCVCSELKYLASNSDLWKQKVFEEFGCMVITQLKISWKEAFVLSYEHRKRVMEVLRSPMPCCLTLTGDSDQFVGPCYDHLAELGARSLIGQPGTSFPELWWPINIPILPNWNW